MKLWTSSHIASARLRKETNLNDFNQSVIEEFRANNGNVGGPFQGSPMVLLTTTGAKSGESRLSPLVYTKDGDNLVVVASKGGGPTNPDWYRNIVANPEVTLEVGSETFKAKATEVHGAERDRLFNAQAEMMPGFRDYEAKTKGIRTIPVVVFKRTES